MITSNDIANRIFEPATLTGACYIANAAVIHCPVAYAEDEKFFYANANRRCYIRSAVFNEFDVLKDIVHFSQIPQMQVLVSKLSDGVYSCMFLYFGRKYASHPMDNDAQVTQIAVTMQREFGRDAEEVKAFHKKLVRVEQAMNATGSAKVH